MHKPIAFALVALLATSAFAAWSGAIESTIWRIEPSSTGTRWLVIHNLASAEADGVYHVEVLERSFGAEVWNIKHVANHMALTPSALRASILKPLKKGAVYPESFDFAFAEWKKQKANGEASICSSSVLGCLK